ncbi:hypothetical protein [Streptomyces griseoluteus]|uniref:hypothetical protein n=1 Tax=Streptomyces griseoluteus TaxID=29306 RepID=UPI0037FCA501
MASVVAVAVCVILQIRRDRPPPVVLFGAVISAALAVLWRARLEPWDTYTGYIATERQFILLRGSAEPAPDSPPVKG